MWEGLEDLLACLESMAQGACTPSFFLSSLDPGVGKTQAIVQFLKALLGSPDYSDIGAFIAVARLDEVRTFAEGADLTQDRYAVLTSDEDLNSVGSGQPRSAQVLFTTQQMVESRTRGKPLAETHDFDFNGKPRVVRVWDESLEPAKGVTLRRDDLMRLATRYRPHRPDLASDLEAFSFPLKDLKDGSIVNVPDLGSIHKLDSGSGLSLISDAPTQEVEAARILWLLSGRTVVVRHDGVHKGTLVSYHDHLPPDLAPIVILDASGRVRATYRWWEKRRGTLIRLKEATKSYRNLTIHVWQRSGSKSAFNDADTARVLLQGIVNTIDKKPTQEWLVVCHKLPKRNLEAEIRELVSIDQSRLHIITWGNHQAINDYVHVPNVILAGTLFLPVSAYEALGRAAADYPATEGELTERRERAIRQTEQHHLVLQALCRGAVRISQGDTCAPCHAYVIASDQSGLPRKLHWVFPKCRLVKWQPVDKVLTGKVKEIADYLLERFEADPTQLIAFGEVAEAFGLSPQNFRKNVRHHKDFKEVMTENAIIERPKEKGKQARYFGMEFYYWFGEEYIDENGGDDIDEYLRQHPDTPDLEHDL